MSSGCGTGRVVHKYRLISGGIFMTGVQQKLTRNEDFDQHRNNIKTPPQKAALGVGMAVAAAVVLTRPNGAQGQHAHSSRQRYLSPGLLGGYGS